MPRGSTDLMADAVLVVLLLVFIWAAVLVPPAAGARAAREAEFLGSIRPGSHPLDGDGNGSRPAPVDAFDEPRFRPAMTANARRRQVLGGLAVAIGATLALGLLPTFRLLLVVNLLLINSALVYVGLLVLARDQKALRTRTEPAPWQARPDVQSEVGAVHPYALDDGYEDEFSGYPAAAYDDQPAYAAAYAGSGDRDFQGEYADQGEYVDQGEYGYEGEGEDDDDLEAAYVDELALPA